MHETSLKARRAEAVTEAMSDIRGIESSLGVTREGVEAIRDRLLVLSTQRELFTFDEFPAPEDDGSGRRRGVLYRISQDPDDRFALYMNSTDGEVSTPAHNHTTWAVVVGLEGQELNRFYDRTVDGRVEAVGEFMVETGTGVAMLPDDLHSIHLNTRSLNFHCYGLALERLSEREYYDAEADDWKIFPAGGNITEARLNREFC
jgi:predicted metal-dependent enzyme (double-stranded beta helix superfamily)